MNVDDLKGDLHALHNICRYNGRVSRHYSVAEHTAIGLECMVRDGVDEEFQKAFFVHDMPEASLGLGDILRPNKVDPTIAAYAAAKEDDYHRQLRKLLDYDAGKVTSDIVKYYDDLMAVAEIKTVAFIKADVPYNPKVHGYAARRINGANADTRPDLYSHLYRLFRVRP